MLESNAGFLVMPWYPHVENRPGSRSLDELRSTVPVLRRLAESGRLLWYDLRTSPARHGPGPVVQATYFSAEAALSLLALAGARRVRTLGVDGGTEYSGQFEDLTGKTLLANGRSSFDIQFEGFARTILDTGVDVAALQVPSPVRVYVAHTDAEALAVAVLQHSVRRRASLSVEFVSLPLDAGTAMEGEAPALVLSPRAHCVSDVRPLWIDGANTEEIAIPAPSPRGSDAIGLALVGPGAGSEIASLASLLRSDAAAARLQNAIRTPIHARLHPEWNPGTTDPNRTKRFISFPPEGTEPWLSRAHRTGYLWVRDLLDAIHRGVISPELVATAIRRGHARPSLGYQVEHRIEEPLLLPRRARILDRNFRPAHREPGRRQSVVATSVAVAQALGRHLERRARELRTRMGPRLVAANR